MADDIKRLDKLRFWCQKVMPSIYDDSLSYYELLGKVVSNLNEMAETVDEVIDSVEDAVSDATEALNVANGIDAKATTALENSQNAISASNEAVSQAENAADSAADSAQSAREAISGNIIPQLAIRFDFDAGSIEWIKADLGASQGEITSFADLTDYISRYTDGSTVSGLNPVMITAVFFNCPNIVTIPTSKKGTVRLFNAIFGETTGPGNIYFTLTGFYHSLDGFEQVNILIPRSNAGWQTFTYEIKHLYEPVI